VWVGASLSGGSFCDAGNIGRGKEADYPLTDRISPARSLAAKVPEEGSDPYRSQGRGGKSSLS
jgi:hypothetical protein